MMKIEIKDLNGIRRDGHLGLYKKGHCISVQDYNLIYDYLEKINYSLQDIKTELEKEPSRSAFICIIAYTCWIQESINELKKCYKPYVFDNFLFDESIIKENDDFLRAIRSFVLAHPFTTKRHKNYGFDETLRCIDISSNSKSKIISLNKDEDKFYIDIKGKTAYNNQKIDYWLCIYNKNKYQNMFKQYIGISIYTICKIINDYVDYLYALDTHMSKTNIQEENK